MLLPEILDVNYVLLIYTLRKYSYHGMLVNQNDVIKITSRYTVPTSVIKYHLSKFIHNELSIQMMGFSFNTLPC